MTISSERNTPHLAWHTEALWAQLEPLLPGLGIEVLARIDSTNTALLERVRRETQTDEGGRQYGRRAGDLLPSLLVAEHQTLGRGRMGRAWVSAPGSSLTFSLGVGLPEADWTGLSLVVGSAIAEALEPAPGAAPRLMLKWPNDLWLDGRKLGGILIETLQANRQRLVVIGVGINVREFGDPADAALAGQFGTGFAALDELLPGIMLPEALARVVPALARALVDFPSKGFAAWQPAYTRRDLTLGRQVTAGALSGESLGVGADASLQVRDADGAVHGVSAGDVSVRLQPS
ncbi:MAG: biotin--[acetyl-CoA-carboxylase] ligase [Pelomonas sp.]|nr:biotin--[acetyl-CoA-carboxylase] ligase [Roseateles sp.]